MEGFDSIIFDLDGTLWDTSKACAAAWNNVLTRNGISFRKITSDDVRAVTGLPHDKCIETIFETLPDEQISLLAAETMEEDMLVITEIGGELYEDVTEGLHKLREKYELFIVSNCQSGYIENFLVQNEVEELFKDHLCWGDTGNSKSLNTRTIVQKNKLINPVFVGDTEGDLKAARDCGIDFFQVAYGFGPPISSCKLANSFSELVLMISGPTE